MELVFGSRWYSISALHVCLFVCFWKFFYSWSAVYVCALGSVAFYNFLLTPNFIIQESSGNAESASLLKLGGSIIGYLCSWLLLYFITTPWIIFVQQFALLIVSVICLPRLFNTCLLFQPPSFKGVSSWYRCHFKKQLSIGFLDVNSYFQSQFFVIVFGSLYGVVYGGQFGITFAVSNMILALSQIPFLVRLHRISKVLDLSSGEKYSIRHEVGYILPSIIIFFFLMVAFNIFLKQNVIQHEFIDAVTSRFLPLDQVNLILLTTFFMMCGSFFSLFSQFKSVSYITLTMLFINISFLAISAAIEHLWQVKGVLVTVCAGSGLGAVVSFWLFRNLQRKNGSPRKIV